MYIRPPLTAHLSSYLFLCPPSFFPLSRRPVPLLFFLLAYLILLLLVPLQLSYPVSFLAPYLLVSRAVSFSSLSSLRPHILATRFMCSCFFFSFSLWFGMLTSFCSCVKLLCYSAAVPSSACRLVCSFCYLIGLRSALFLVLLLSAAGISSPLVF